MTGSRVKDDGLVQKSADVQLGEIGLPTMTRFSSEGSNPQIRIASDLSDGQAVVAACHAALAWRLRVRDGEGLRLRFEQLTPESFLRISRSELGAHAPSGPFIEMTESKLGNQIVSIVESENVGLQIEPLKDISGTVSAQDLHLLHLKMYVLVTKGTFPNEAMLSAANAVLRCYDDHQDDQYMQDWSNSRFVKTVCLVGKKEFERAIAEVPKHALGHASDGAVTAVAFSPQTSWPRPFKFFQLYR